METLIDGWNNNIPQCIPTTIQRLVQKHKAPISGSIALLVLYYSYKKWTRIPQNLRHIPRVGIWKFIYGRLANNPIDDFYNEYVFPVAKGLEHGLYARFDIFRWSVNVVEPEVVKKILLKPNIFAKLNLEEQMKGTLLARLTFGPNIVFLNGNAWKHQRMIANPVFHRAMPVDIFGRLAVKLFESIDLQEGHVNFQDVIKRYTLDVLGRGVLGFDFNSIEDKNSEWVLAYDQVMSNLRTPLYYLFPILDTKLRFLIPGRQKKHEQATKLLSLLNGIIWNKREALRQSKGPQIKDSEKDLVTLLIEAGSECGQALTDEELLSNTCIYFAGGHDTTASALLFAAYYLAVNQDIQKKAREEVISVLGDDPKNILPTSEQTREMPYINKIIKEALRIRSPTTTLTPRVAVEDTDLNGVFIPKGTWLNLDIYALHNNPALWKDPEVFDPERFAPGGEAEHSGLAWLPFGGGGRQCIGMNFSMAQQRVLLSMLLRKYEFSLPENSIHKKKIILEPSQILDTKGMNMEFKRRY
ncbi:cytochrome P450 [Fennellomyces sp. T-0311]|nr:cytochrome P450 [Fennellomyces sp. T-0311]